MKNSALLQSQSNVENTDKQNSSNENTELIKMYRVKDTPFRVIHEADRGWYVVMLKYRLTEVFKTVEEMEEYTGLYVDYDENFEQQYIAGQTPLAFLTTIISAIVDETINLSNNKQKLQQ